jgi:hypothetical protein
LIIGLTGKKGSGKDTAAKYLVDNYGYERKAFADSLKRSVAALFDIPFERVDEWKVNQPGKLDNVEVIIDVAHPDRTTQYSMSWREFLQRYGTESHREIFGYDFWVDQVLPYYPNSNDYPRYYELKNKKFVISDVRFENEAARVAYYGGRVIEIIRPSLNNVVDTHVSERIPPANFEFLNLEDNMVNLYNALDEFMEHHDTVR